MEEEAIVNPAAVSRPVMPHRLDHMIRIELVDHICALFSREDVPCHHILERLKMTHIYLIYGKHFLVMCRH